MFNFWNREDSLKEKELYDPEYILAKEERDKNEELLRKERNKKEPEKKSDTEITIKIIIKNDVVTITCKSKVPKKDKITDYFNKK
jgi:hypothetical protein